MLIEARFVQIPDEAMAQLGLEAFQAPQSDTAVGSLINEQELRSILQELERTQGADVLSAPRVSTVDGRQAQISILELKNLPGVDGPVSLGPSVDVVPTVAPDGRSIDLTLLAELNLPKEPPGEPQPKGEAVP